MTIGRRAALWALTGAPLAWASGRGNLARIEQQIFDGMNIQRSAYGVSILEWDPVLCTTAREHSRRMLDAAFFGHTDPVYGDLARRLNAAGVTWSRCGENVLKEKDYSDPAAIAVIEWMYSRGHRDNVLNTEFRLTGVGVAQSEDGTFTATQQFVAPVSK